MPWTLIKLGHVWVLSLTWITIRISGLSGSVMLSKFQPWCIYTCTYMYIHTTHMHACTAICMYTHALSLETTTCLPQSSMEGIYPPNQGMLSNLFTNIEFRPGRRTPRRVDGSLTIAGTWIKRPGPGATTTSCIIWCIYMMNPHCWLVRPMQGIPDPTWSSPHGQGQGCCH